MMSLLVPDIPDWLQSFRPTREAAIGFALIGLYYLVVWLAVGSDPEPGTIVVSYDPPRGLSPATLRYLCKKGFDEKGFSSALLNLAVKGFVEIASCEDFYRLNRGTADASVLSPEEKTLTDILMGRDSSFDLKESNQHRVYFAIRAMSHTLDLAITKTYMRINRNYLLPGTLASAFLLLYLAIQGPWERPDVVAFLVFFTSVWMLLCPILVLYLVHVWRGIPGQKGRPGISGQRAFSLALFSLPCVLASIVSIVSLAFLAAPWFAALFLILFSLVFVMFSAMKAPTKAGRVLLDEIEGFRRFLIGVESDRLDRESRPERNSKLLERLLPYAFALDAHEEWARQFSDVAIADVGAQLENAEQSSHSSGQCLDLSSFAVFVQRWYPFDLKDVKFTIGSAAGH
jgi:Predicted membrane protein (DUF2207)